MTSRSEWHKREMFEMQKLQLFIQSAVRVTLNPRGQIIVYHQEYGGKRD